jgi:hypothetical protein
MAPFLSWLQATTAGHWLVRLALRHSCKSTEGLNDVFFFFCFLFYFECFCVRFWFLLYVDNDWLTLRHCALTGCFQVPLIFHGAEKYIRRLLPQGKTHHQDVLNTILRLVATSPTALPFPVQ